MGAMDSVDRRFSRVLDALLVAADRVLDLHEACAAPRDREALNAALRALINARGLLEELAFGMMVDVSTDEAHAEAIRLATRAPLGEAP